VIAGHKESKTQPWCDGFRAAEMPQCRAEQEVTSEAAGRGKCPAAKQRDTAERWQEQDCRAKTKNHGLNCQEGNLR